MNTKFIEAASIKSLNNALEAIGQNFKWVKVDGDDLVSEDGVRMSLRMIPKYNDENGKISVKSESIINTSLLLGKDGRVAWRYGAETNAHMIIMVNFFLSTKRIARDYMDICEQNDMNGIRKRVNNA